MNFDPNTSDRILESSCAGSTTQRVMASSNIVVLDSEIAAVFPNSASVNRALHSLVQVAQKASGLTRRSTGRAKAARRGTRR
jgi:hypothetical protein